MDRPLLVFLLVFVKLTGSFAISENSDLALLADLDEKLTYDFAYQKTWDNGSSTLSCYGADCIGKVLKSSLSRRHRVDSEDEDDTRQMEYFIFGVSLASKLEESPKDGGDRGDGKESRKMTKTIPRFFLPVDSIILTFIFVIGFFLFRYFILVKRDKLNKTKATGDVNVDGRWIGQLFVSNEEISRGCNGTIVVEGTYHSIPVAVKRLLKSHNSIANKEFDILKAARAHPNIIQWYGREEDTDFVYLSLEKCLCNLRELIYFFSQSSNTRVTTKENKTSLQLQCKVKNINDIRLWKTNGYPTRQLLKLMKGIVRGVSHLHFLRIVHRDLKPENVLVTVDLADEMLMVKITDMGISKVLSANKYSISSDSIGWQAIEILQRGRQTMAVDLFSLGCILFFCVTGGSHPFGEDIERDVNILNNNFDFFIIDHMPEAVNLFSRLLDPNPVMGPNTSEVLKHPFFWDSKQRISFLSNASDFMELEIKMGNTNLLSALKNISAFKGNWSKKLDKAVLTDIGIYRQYDYSSVRDLLRVIRNKSSHYIELPRHIQELLGPLPDGFDEYFSSRFPKLLFEVYTVILRCFGQQFLMERCLVL